MHVLRSLLMTATKHNFIFTAQHVAASDNKVPDALSHFNWQAFRHLAPHASLVGDFNLPSLEQDCFAMVALGLAPSMHRTSKSKLL